MTNNEWGDWFAHATGGASASAVAKAIDGAGTTVARWLREGVMPADGAVAIARAYGTDPVEALIATGYLRRAEADANADDAGIRTAPTQSLLEELMRRQLVGSLNHMQPMARKE